MTAAAPSDPQPDLPLAVLDAAYLAEMRDWLGAATLAGLLAGAPDSFRPAVAEVAACWRAGALADLREAAHRLAGAAGSIGARRLADLARRCQTMTEAELSDAVVGTLAAAAEEALAALAALPLAMD